MTAGSTIAAVALAVLVAVLAVVPWLVSDYGLGFMVNLMCYLVLTIAWALFSGTTRYVSLATAAFFGLGAYTVAMLVKEMRKSLPEGFFGDSADGDIYGAWFDQHVGSAIAKSGALHLRPMVQRGLAEVPAYAEVLNTAKGIR